MHSTIALDILREETRQRRGRADRLGPHLSALKVCCGRLRRIRGTKQRCCAAA